MGHAISNTFKSIVSSSITTVAGFAALCLMTFALGKNLGIVMAKGVIIGVICCVTLLPAIILIPGVSGNTSAGINGVKKSVEQAVGSDILFSGN
mgnify:CR=1 FL=1